VIGYQTQIGELQKQKTYMENAMLRALQDSAAREASIRQELDHATQAAEVKVCDSA
jgi:hypothetical protein